MTPRRALRLPLLVALALSTWGCSKPKSGGSTSSKASDKFALADELATSDLASVATAAHVTGQWRTFLFWDPARKATMAEARLVFSGDPADPLADPPYLTADLFQVEIGPPAKIVTHADVEKLRKAAEQAPRIEQALSVARADLKTLERYRGWQSEKWRYQADVSVSPDGSRVTVVFDPPGVTDNDVRIVVDPVAKSVVGRDVHME